MKENQSLWHVYFKLNYLFGPFIYQKILVWSLSSLFISFF